MSILTSWLASPPPDAALEIGPESVSAVMIGSRGRQLVVQGQATEPLAPGAVVASLTAHNIVDRAAVLAAVRAVLERLDGRPRRVALVLPDLVARVSLMHFDRIPAQREDLDQLVRWQMKKAAPFPMDDACLSYVPGVRSPDGGGELIVVAARRDIVREYEGVCEALGLYPGLVDLATFGVVNLALASDPPPVGDWLVVHIRPEYTSVAIVRDTDIIFFSTRAEDGQGSLADLVHQTTMYYQDRLSGQGFSRVVLGGAGRTPAALLTARQEIEARLGLAAQPLAPADVIVLTDRISASPEWLATLSPLVGTLARTRAARGGH